MATTVGDVVVERPAPRPLLRVLGASFGIAIAVGATIGGGILRSPGIVAAALPNAGLYMLAWALGGVNALLGASAFAELGAMVPRSGGLYVYAHRAFGDGVGFFLGYADWLTLTVSTTALVLLVGEYSSAVTPALQQHAPAIGMCALAVIALSQWRGVRSGARIQEATSVFKTVALLGLVIAIFALSKGRMPTAAHPPHLATGVALIGAFGLAMQGVVFTYDSYYSAVYCGDEIKNPGRELPRSIFRGLWLIIAIYLVVNLAFVAVLPMSRIANDPFVGATVSRWVFGARGDGIIRWLMIVSILGTANALLIEASRVVYAMSRDRLFPRMGERVNRGGTPSTALAITAAVSLLFALTGSANAVLGFGALLIVVRYVVVFAALFQLRRSEPDIERPYRAFGYPWLPGLALLLSVAFLVTNAIAAPRAMSIVVALLAASWPISRFARSRGA